MLKYDKYVVKAEKLLINDKNCSLNRSWKFEERLKMNEIEGWSRQCLSIDISQPSATAMQQNYNHHHAISISVSKCISKLGSLFVMSCRSLSIYHLHVHQVLYICIILYHIICLKNADSSEINVEADFENKFHMIDATWLRLQICDQNFLKRNP